MACASLFPQSSATELTHSLDKYEPLCISLITVVSLGLTMYRLYVDEVGTASLTHLEKDKHRYLSLTGLAIDLKHVSSSLEPNMNWIKVNVFEHDPDSPIIFHRTDILGRKGPFGILSNLEKCKKFDEAIIRLVIATDFTAITAFIDKQAIIKKNKLEKEGAVFLSYGNSSREVCSIPRAKSDIGDIMPEARGNQLDQNLQEAFCEVKRNGTYYVSKSRLASHIRADNLKFRTKKDNIAGLQLCDLLAHPSHMYVRETLRHQVCIGQFSRRISNILIEKKYDRSPSGKIKGYGIKIAS